MGVGAGFVGGLFGVGGGVVMVPGLVLLMGLDQHRAHATSVAAIVAVASAALVPFVADGEVDWSAAGAILLGSVVGAVLGARLIARISPVWLARTFVIITVVAAARMWVTA